ncbi:hypothetical protein ACIU1J_15195 [Azospirillum doebereinerae]|uniref:hypothetical protein n=1 Tax=Azospirillum doebereinerae TaxID=92933 RepID=UPI001EE55BC6|nr:hypothetical protein [Azospirillum doebereinerae]MCG5239951.1 hypothetical protein [Azospirillum doebereinerae]
MRAVCGYNPAGVKAMRLRFEAPVFPGKSLCVTLRLAAPDRTRFSANAVERGLRVVDEGLLEHIGTPGMTNTRKGKRA